MLSMFALPKPFKGHIGVIQRNAIASWARLPSKPEIILFGDEEGTAQAARDLGVHHEPNIPRHEFDTPLMSGVFERGYAMTDSPMICYINSDIILLGDFLGAVRQVRAKLHEVAFPQRHSLSLEVHPCGKREQQDPPFRTRWP